MYSAALLVLSAVDALLVAWILREWLRRREAVLALILFLAAALPYDTALVGLGRWIGAGETLELLSGPRFALFNLSMPLTIIIAAGLGRLGGLSWLQSRAAMGAVCVVATAFLVADWRHILQFDPLYPACWADSIRYVPSVAAEQACAPGQAGIGAPSHLPTAFIVGVPALFIVAALLWWRARWPWMFVGVAAAFVLLGIPTRLVGPIAGFIGDSLNLFALAATAVKFSRRPPR
jgi:hypothetical protein